MNRARRHAPEETAGVAVSLTIALAGQPNVGKTTIFNMLTGLNQHVGNWPGKTVEQKIGFLSWGSRQIRLVDLPGTYSLTANSEEERIARDFLLREKPDVVIVIVSAATLERNLYLVTELLAMPVRIVIGINMLDVAEHAGMHIEPHVLQAALGIPVIPLIATQRRGLDELLEATLSLADGTRPFQPCRPIMSPEHQTILLAIQRQLAGQPLPYPLDWVALKLLEGDTEITTFVRQHAPSAWETIHPMLQQHEDAHLDIIRGRYAWIERMVRAALTRPRGGIIHLTDRLDKIATHPLWGLVTLLAIWGAVFWLTYTLAAPIVAALNRLFAYLAQGVHQALDALFPWLGSLLADGLIGGVGAVLSLLPVLILFFAALGLLEDVGYLARSAYVMDRFMHWIGLHGRSFLPLSLGFGCNVPAVMGARIVEDRRARLLTILLAPLVPCSGRMTVIVFLAPAFFGTQAALVTWGLVVGNLLLLFLVGLILHRRLFRGQPLAFIMEMPLYHRPNLRTIGLYVWQHTWAFVRKAGTTIVIASLLVWMLAYLPYGQAENSLLALLGHGLEPLGRWLGLGDWRLITALLASFFAKENAIATLGILFGNSPESGLAEQVARSLSPAAGLAFLVAHITFIPCAATLAVIRQETGTWKWPGISVGLLLAVSLGMATLVYHLARLAGL